jgi:multidrug transporter EmrE-like cation transporter
MEGLVSNSSSAGMSLTLIELVGDTSLKQYATDDNPLFLATGIVSYLGLVYVLQNALRTEKLAIVNGYWDAYSNILTTGAGMMMGEVYSNKQIAGLLLIGAGLWLL